MAVKPKITKELVNNLMDQAIESGCVDSHDTHKYITKRLENYEYTFNELFEMEVAYNHVHPGIYVEVFYSIDKPSPDPYATDGIVFSYHFLKRQLYSHGNHSISGGFGSGYGGGGRR